MGINKPKYYVLSLSLSHMHEGLFLQTTTNIYFALFIATLFHSSSYLIATFFID